MARTRHLILALAVLLAGAGRSSAAIVISQYYESATESKWIELYNTGAVAVNLGTGGFRLGIWSDANSEGYKSDVAPNRTITILGTVNAGSTFLIKNTSPSEPTYAVSNFNGGANLSFTGNDSVGLYNSAIFTTSSLVDAIGFTDAGNQGQDVSFSRVSLNTGFDTTAGSNVTDFSSVWQQFSTDQVNAAPAGVNERLGFFDPAAVPEPASVTLLGVAAIVAAVAPLSRRLKSRSRGT